MTTPPGRTTGRSAASEANEVSRRGPSSAVTSTVDLPAAASTGTISASNRPASTAATARWCERRAKASAASRVMPSNAATSSAVSGIEKVSRSLNLGLLKRQPIDVSKICPGRAKAFSGFAMTQGARLIDSTPPATTTSAAPAATIWAASVIADIPEAHNRFTVIPGTVFGNPASSKAIRATFRLSSPDWFALPRITSSTAAGSMPVRSSNPASTVAARSSGRTEESAPP